MPKIKRMLCVICVLAVILAGAMQHNPTAVLASRTRTVTNVNDTEEEETTEEEEETTEEEGTTEEEETTEEATTEQEASTEEATSEEEQTPEETEEESVEDSSSTDYQLADYEIIVSSYAELKDTLEKNDGKSIIYFGADISMGSGGISVISSKGTFILDGRNPETGQIHTLTDYSSSDHSRTIYIEGINHTSKNIVVRNLKIIGKNHYGPVSFTEASSVNATLSYENVNYTGPQLAYIRFGTLVLDNSNVVIQKESSDANEVAESSGVVLKNKVNISQNSSNSNSFFWILQNSNSIEPYILINPGAEVIVTPYSGNYASVFVYASYNKVGITFGKNSSFTFNGQGAFWNTNPLTSVIVEEAAEVYIKTEYGLARPLLQVNGNMTIREDSIVHLENRTNLTQSSLDIRGGKLTIENPKRVVLYNRVAPALAWGNDSSTMQVITQQLNYWNPLSEGGFSQSSIPDYSWMKKDEKFLTVEASGSLNNNMRTVASNYEGGFHQDPSTNILKGDVFDALDANNFIVSKARILSFGQAQNISGAYDFATQNVAGMSKAGSDIAVFQQEEQTEPEEIRSFTTVGQGQVDGSGIYSINISNPDVLAEQLRIQSHYQFLYSPKVSCANSVLLLEAPREIYFNTTKINGKKQLIKRNEESQELLVKIIDGRAFPDMWRVSIRATNFEPADLSQTALEMVPNLAGNLVFVDDLGRINPLYEDEEYLLEEKMNGGSVEYTWDEDRGLLAQIETSSAYVNVSYESRIIWTLTAGP